MHGFNAEPCRLAAEVFGLFAGLFAGVIAALSLGLLPGHFDHARPFPSEVLHGRMITLACLCAERSMAREAGRSTVGARDR